MVLHMLKCKEPQMTAYKNKLYKTYRHGFYDNKTHNIRYWRWFELPYQKIYLNFHKNTQLSWDLLEENY